MVDELLQAFPDPSTLPKGQWKKLSALVKRRLADSILSLGLSLPPYVGPEYRPLDGVPAPLRTTPPPQEAPSTGLGAGDLPPPPQSTQPPPPPPPPAAGPVLAPPPPPVPQSAAPRTHLSMVPAEYASVLQQITSTKNLTKLVDSQTSDTSVIVYEAGVQAQIQGLMSQALSKASGFKVPVLLVQNGGLAFPLAVHPPPPVSDTSPAAARDSLIAHAGALKSCALSVIGGPLGMAKAFAEVEAKHLSLTIGLLLDVAPVVARPLVGALGYTSIALLHPQDPANALVTFSQKPFFKEVERTLLPAYLESIRHLGYPAHYLRPSERYSPLSLPPAVPATVPPPQPGLLAPRPPQIPPPPPDRAYTAPPQAKRQRSSHIFTFPGSSGVYCGTCGHTGEDEKAKKCLDQCSRRTHDCISIPLSTYKGSLPYRFGPAAANPSQPAVMVFKSSGPSYRGKVLVVVDVARLHVTKDKYLALLKPCQNLSADDKAAISAALDLSEGLPAALGSFVDPQGSN